MAACLLEDDVVKLRGEKGQRVLNCANRRYKSQRGYVILGGQKVTVERPRVRSFQSEEVPLKIYTKLQSEDAMSRTGPAQMVRSVSRRDYEGVADAAQTGFGVKKSSVSRNFVQATREQVQNLRERNFEETAFSAVFGDGIPFSGGIMVVAMCVSGSGSQHVMGLVRGETERR